MTIETELVHITPDKRLVYTPEQWSKVVEWLTPDEVERMPYDVLKDKIVEIAKDYVDIIIEDK